MFLFSLLCSPCTCSFSPIILPSFFTFLSYKYSVLHIHEHTFKHTHQPIFIIGKRIDDIKGYYFTLLDEKESTTITPILETLLAKRSASGIAPTPQKVKNIFIKIDFSLHFSSRLFFITIYKPTMYFDICYLFPAIFVDFSLPVYVCACVLIGE